MRTLNQIQFNSKQKSVSQWQLGLLSVSMYEYHNGLEPGLEPRITIKNPKKHCKIRVYRFAIQCIQTSAVNLEVVGHFIHCDHSSL